MNYNLCILLMLLCTEICTAQKERDVECGTQRWDVKTLSDYSARWVRYDSIYTATISELTRLPALRPARTSPRLAEETIVYRVQAVAYEIRRQDDGDIHVLLCDLETDSTMITEIPDPDCPGIKGTQRAVLFDAARRWVIDSLVIPSIVEMVGVAFVDVAHKQKGRAANGYELHPVLMIGKPSASGLVWSGPPPFNDGKIKSVTE
jgi:hypothetical protein